MTTENTGASGTASDLDLFEAEATGQPVQKSETIPEKYSGKSVEDLIKMNQNAEKLIGRQGSELGQMRRMADEILQLKKPTTEVRHEERKPVTVDSLLNDPEKALNSAMDNSPVARRAADAEARVARLETSLAEQSFVSKHKEFANDLQDPEFTAWINKNQVRLELGQRAANQDFKAATNLWDMWQEHKELVGESKQSSPSKQKNVPTGVKTAPAQMKGKPNWSRTKLMELRMKVADGDPSAVARWSDKTFQERMHEAYAEDRVV